MIRFKRVVDLSRLILASFDRKWLEVGLWHSARYLADGFFSPEVVLCMERPTSVAERFPIRHHPL